MQRRIPRWAGWLALVWLAIWVPAYWRTWGAANFLHLCDVSVILTCIGLWRGNALMLSSQAIESLLGDALWCMDALWRALSGRQLTGGTEYLFDARFPLWVRLLSLFHVALPLTLLWAVRRTGYDRRGLPLQCGIAAAAILLGRLAPSSANINFAWRDPLYHRQWGPAPLHLALIFAATVTLTYLPIHVMLSRWFPARQRPG